MWRLTTDTFWRLETDEILIANRRSVLRLNSGATEHFLHLLGISASPCPDPEGCEPVLALLRSSGAITRSDAGVENPRLHHLAHGGEAS